MTAQHDDGLYPTPLISSLRHLGTFWRVGALAVFFIAAAIAVSVFGDRIPGDYVMVFLGLLAVVGVFSLFALAAGLFRFTSGDEGGNSLPRGDRRQPALRRGGDRPRRQDRLRQCVNMASSKGAMSGGVPKLTCRGSSPASRKSARRCIG